MTLRSAPFGSLLVLLIGTGVAEAQVVRPLSGEARFGIGDGFRVPISPGTLMCVPQGGIAGIPAIAGAQITTTGGVGGTIMIPGSQLTLRGPGKPLAPQVRGLPSQHPIALQLYTNFAIRIPAPPGDTLHAGSGIAPAGGSMGRTGPDVVTWCPGSTATVQAGSNPGCVNLGSHNPVTIPTCGASPNPCPGPNEAKVVIPGLMRYTRTGRMLGGPGSGALSGKFDVAIGAPGGGAFFVPGKAPPRLPQGRAFGAYIQQNAGKGPLRAPVMANSCGVISSVGAQLLEKAASDRTTASFGGPFTQGMLTLAVDTGIGVESYRITGHDYRTAMGARKIQLVSGSLGIRSISGANANRAWITLDVPEPAPIAAAVAVLMMLAVCHRALRRRDLLDKRS